MGRGHLTDWIMKSAVDDSTSTRPITVVVVVVFVLLSFFLACEDFGKLFDNSLPAYAFFFF